jgi:glycosyltransferase involved in cell wall biosynthesis
MTPISVIILTKNEEEFIERCIRSVLWADEVLVLDSDSTDKTREIAASLGANVYEQEWLGGYTIQRHKGISLAKNDWVFVVDCDEIVTPELAQSIKEEMSGSVDNRNGYSVFRPGDFLGILLPNFERPKYKFHLRLFNKQYADYKPTINPHEKISVPGKAIPLQGVLIHWRGYVMDEYITSANRFATQEAKALQEKGYRVNGLIIFLRPILRFLWCYVAKGGFRLGTRGVIHAMLASTREYIRYAKLWEMQNMKRVPHPPAQIYSHSPVMTKSKDVVDTINPR